MSNSQVHDTINKSTLKEDATLDPKLKSNHHLYEITIKVDKIQGILKLFFLR